MATKRPLLEETSDSPERKQKRPNNESLTKEGIVVFLFTEIGQKHLNLC